MSVFEHRVFHVLKQGFKHVAMLSDGWLTVYYPFVGNDHVDFKLGLFVLFFADHFCEFFLVSVDALNNNRANHPYNQLTQQIILRLSVNHD